MFFFLVPFDLLVASLISPDDQLSGARLALWRTVVYRRGEVHVFFVEYVARWVLPSQARYREPFGRMGVMTGSPYKGRDCTARRIIGS